MFLTLGHLTETFLYMLVRAGRMWQSGPARSSFSEEWLWTEAWREGVRVGRQSQSVLSSITHTTQRSVGFGLFPETVAFFKRHTVPSQCVRQIIARYVATGPGPLSVHRETVEGGAFHRAGCRVIWEDSHKSLGQIHERDHL